MHETLSLVLAWVADLMAAGDDAHAIAIQVQGAGQPGGFGFQVVDPLWFGREVPPRFVVGRVEAWLHHGQPGRLPAPPATIGCAASTRVTSSTW